MKSEDETLPSDHLKRNDLIYLKQRLKPSFLYLILGKINEA